MKFLKDINDHDHDNEKQSTKFDNDISNTTNKFYLLFYITTTLSIITVGLFLVVFTKWHSRLSMQWESHLEQFTNSNKFITVIPIKYIFSTAVGTNYLLVICYFIIYLLTVFRIDKARWKALFKLSAIKLLFSVLLTLIKLFDMNYFIISGLEAYVIYFVHRIVKSIDMLDGTDSDKLNSDNNYI
jgi:hypothetical protein